MEWQIVTVIAALIALVSAITTPLLRLNSNVVKLDITMRDVGSQLSKLDTENRESHKEIYARLDHKGKVLERHETIIADHDRRIERLEEKE